MPTAGSGIRSRFGRSWLLRLCRVPPYAYTLQLFGLGQCTELRIAAESAATAAEKQVVARRSALRFRYSLHICSAWREICLRTPEGHFRHRWQLLITLMTNGERLHMDKPHYTTHVRLACRGEASLCGVSDLPSHWQVFRQNFFGYSSFDTEEEVRAHGSLGNRWPNLPMQHFARTCCKDYGSASYSSLSKSRSTCMHSGSFRFRRFGELVGTPSTLRTRPSKQRARSNLAPAHRLTVGTRKEMEVSPSRFPKHLADPRRIEFVRVLNEGDDPRCFVWVEYRIYCPGRTRAQHWSGPPQTYCTICIPVPAELTLTLCSLHRSVVPGPSTRGDGACAASARIRRSCGKCSVLKANLKH